jgi:hypothetical protein
MIYTFNPPIDRNHWEVFSMVLKNLYPNIKWTSLKKIEEPPPVPVYHIFVNTNRKSPKVTYSDMLYEKFIDFTSENMDGWFAIDEYYDYGDKFFDDLVNEEKIKLGDDFLYCHRDLLMDDGEIEALKGKTYPIENYRGKMIIIKNESGEHHLFDTDSYSPDYYGNWFHLVTGSDIIDNFIF